MDRERYGRGGGGGINRYPDVSARTGSSGPAREDRSYSRDRGRDDRPRDDRPREAARSSSSSEPWSEVPPELEAMLRAQVATKPTSDIETTPVVVDTDAAAEETAKPKRTTRSRATAATAAATTDADAPEAKPKRVTKPRTTTRSTASADVDGAAAVEPEAKPKRRTSTKKAAAGTAEPTDGAADAASDADTPAAKPKRTTRAKTATTDAV